MTALECLEGMIAENTRAIKEAHKHHNSVTRNANVANLLTIINTDLNYVVKEILKGNSK